jgi:hypothetical protein
VATVLPSTIESGVKAGEVIEQGAPMHRFQPERQTHRSWVVERSITKNPMVQEQAGWQGKPEFPFGREGIE